MGEKQLNERALELRREYQREWRRKNKEKVRANNLRYWERKAQKSAQERQVQ
ncbi:phosphatase [Clostridium sp. DFI.5.61]|uniref:phosphatase n=1 Tax=unclassified Clostridium TaxID=2614128 RepID=UPI00210BBC9F|nr:phosphatase [Clostridium sp. DFI.5.61]MCB5927174.1 phosphatase [bacterium 210820-DFI.5.26]MCQ5160993.1 phosphatase [Clostridium sp. DFI.5.61]